MRRGSVNYIKSKLLHGCLRLLSEPPARLYLIPGYLHPMEGRFLYWLAGRVPRGGRAVEIGSFKGKSSSFIAAGLPRGARLACVDSWLNDAMPDEPADVLPEFLDNTKEHAARIDILRGRSSEVAAEWTGVQIDFLFVDGDHSYEGCRSDIESWSPFLRRGSWVAFHDSGMAGVASAIRDAAPRFSFASRLQAWSVLAGRVAG